MSISDDNIRNRQRKYIIRAAARWYIRTLVNKICRRRQCRCSPCYDIIVYAAHQAKCILSVELGRT